MVLVYFQVVIIINNNIFIFNFKIIKIMSFENLLGKSFPVQLDERVTQMEKKIYTTIRDMKDRMEKLELIDKTIPEKMNEIIGEDVNKIKNKKYYYL
jgi:hypothetical protein